MTTPEVCACGCGASLDPLRSDAKYASAACRTRAYRFREESKAKASRKRNGGRGQRQRVLQVLHAVGGRGITHDYPLPDRPELSDDTAHVIDAIEGQTTIFDEDVAA